MGLDEYLLGLLAIISGLALTEMIAGLHLLLFQRKRIKWSWLTPIAAFFIAWAILASWWISWTSNHDRTQSMMFGQFMLPVGQLVCLVLAARGIMPTEVSGAKGSLYDLEKHYFSVKRYVWLAMVANTALLIVAWAVAKTIQSAGTESLAVSLPALVAGTLAFLALALIDGRRFHQVFLPIATAVLIALTIGQTIIG